MRDNRALLFDLALAFVLGLVAAAVLLTAGCGGPALPAGVTAEQAKAACLDLRQAQHDAGYTITAKDELHGIPALHDIKDPSRREFKRLMVKVMLKHGLTNDNVLDVWRYGKQRGW